MSPTRPTMRFDPQTYGTELAQLLAEERRADLGPGRADAALERTLARLLDDGHLAGRQVVDRDWGDACRAALWLHFDFLDRSHQISQSLETPAGCYWHGIMHRREGDYGNAKYWFRQAGPHPIEAELNQAARAEAVASARREPLPSAARYLLETSTWSAPRFVDLCAAVVEHGASCAALGREIQWLEWQLLFDYGWTRAVEQRLAVSP